MMTMDEALRRARKYPPPAKPGVIWTISPVEAALAYMKLHGLEAARNTLGHPRWNGNVLVVRPTPDPSPNIAARGFGEGGSLE